MCRTFASDEIGCRQLAKAASRLAENSAGCQYTLYIIKRGALYTPLESMHYSGD